MKSDLFLFEVKMLAIELINKAYTVETCRGFITYDLRVDNWDFEFNEHKTAPAQCSIFYNTIYISEWMCKRVNVEISLWRSIILHEVAHAIDVKVRGTSNHDNHWADICTQIGGLASATVSMPFFDEALTHTIYCLDCDMSEDVPHIPDSVKFGLSCCGCCNGNLSYKKKN